MTTQLTPRQRAILDAIRAHWINANIPPTLKEIGRAVHVASMSVLLDELDALEAAGYIRRTPYIARSIVLVGPRVPRDIAATLLAALKFDREEWGPTSDNLRAEAWVKGEA